MDSENIRSKFLTDKSLVTSSKEDKGSLSQIAMSYYKKFAHNRDIKQYFIISSTLNSSDELVEKPSDQPECSYKISPSKSAVNNPVVKERKKWARPPITGQDNLYLSDNTEGVFEESFDGGRMSPASSIASYKRLEWDSGADVGYQNAALQNQHNRSISLPVLNTLDKLTLNRSPSEPGDSNFTNPIIQYETTSLERKKKKFIVAQSTPLPTIKSSFFDIQMTPVTSNAEIDPFKQITELKSKIDQVLSKQSLSNTQLPEKSSKICKDIKDRSSQVSPESIFKAPTSHQLIQTTLQKGTSKSVQAPSTSQSPIEYQCSPEFLTTTSYEQLRGNEIYSNLCPFESVNIPKSNSFEYLPGDSYEQRTNSDNYPSISPDNINTNLSSTDYPKCLTCHKRSSACSCKSYGSSQDSLFISSQLSTSLTEDLKQTALVLRRMIESRKCTPKEKKQLIKLIVKKIVETHYDEDEEVSGSSKSDKIKENVSGKKEYSHTSGSCRSDSESSSTLESEKKRTKKKFGHKNKMSYKQKAEYESSSDESILQGIYDKLGLRETEKGTLEKIKGSSNEGSIDKIKGGPGQIELHSSTSSITKTITRSDFELNVEKGLNNDDQNSKSNLMSEFSKSESCLVSADKNWKDSVTLSEKLFEARAKYIRVQNDLLKIQREDKSLNTTGSLFPPLKLSDKILGDIIEKDYVKNLRVIETEIEQLTHLKSLLEQKSKAQLVTPAIYTVHGVETLNNPDSLHPSQNFPDKSSIKVDDDNMKKSHIFGQNIPVRSFVNAHFEPFIRTSQTSVVSNENPQSKDPDLPANNSSQNSGISGTQDTIYSGKSRSLEPLNFLKENRFMHDSSTDQKEQYEFEGAFNQEITNQIVKNLMHLRDNPEEFLYHGAKQLDSDSDASLNSKINNSQLKRKQEEDVEHAKKMWDTILRKLQNKRYEKNSTEDGLLASVLSSRQPYSGSILKEDNKFLDVQVAPSPVTSQYQPVNNQVKHYEKNEEMMLKQGEYDDRFSIDKLKKFRQNVEFSDQEITQSPSKVKPAELKSVDKSENALEKTNFSSQTRPLVQNQATETIDIYYMQERSTQTECLCQNFNSSPRIGRVLERSHFPGEFSTQKTTKKSSAQRRPSQSPPYQSTPRASISSRSYPTPNSQSLRSSPTILSNMAQSTQTTIDEFPLDKSSDTSYQCNCRFAEQEYLRQKIKDQISNCECCRLKKTHKKKYQHRHKSEKETSSFCSCYSQGHHRHHKHDVLLCPRCSRCRCACKCQRTPRSSKKNQTYKKQPGVSYFLRLESQEDIVDQDEITSRRQSIQEVKIYVPKRRATSSQRSSTGKTDSIPFEPQRQQEYSTKIPPLQDYLVKNRPDFIHAACERRQELTEAALARHQRAEQRRQLLLMMADSSKINDLAKNLKNFELPKQQPHRKRAFTYKTMREITKRHYKELPEVKQKKDQRRLQQQARANRLMMQIFNKKLQKHVHQGNVSLSYSVSLISTL